MNNYKITKTGLKNIKKDLQYQESIIKKVKSCGKELEIRTEIGEMMVPKENVKDFEPKEGMPIRFYGRGLGYTVRGVTIPTDDNTIIFYYRTPEEAEEDFQDWIKEEDAKRLKQFEKDKIALDKAFNELPECFQKRIEKFRSNNSKFRIDYEFYETFCIKEAIKIANKLKTVEAIDNFKHMGWGGQRMIVDIDPDHSGNTFECSIALAKTYLTKPEDLVNVHGALCPLVGCGTYGCVKKE